MDGQNHIIAVTPLKFLPITEFEKSQKSFDKTPETELQVGFMSSVSNWLASWTPALSWSRAPSRQDQVGILSKFELMERIKSEVFQKKAKANELKEKGNQAFQEKRYDEAESLYSEAIEFNVGSGILWTSRATCRNVMKKYEESLADCDTALTLDPKCTQAFIEKGNAFLSLKRFDEAKECFESLRSFGRSDLADTYLKKLYDIQDKDLNTFLNKFFKCLKLSRQ